VRPDYGWSELYEVAIFETDDGKLQQYIQASKRAIDTRLHEMQLDHGGTPEERQAITDALKVLNVLRRELETRSLYAGSSNA
jgi:Trp operon repressor